MKLYEVIGGFLSAAALVAADALSWDLSSTTVGVLVGLVGLVLPRPSEVVEALRKPKA